MLEAADAGQIGAIETAAIALGRLDVAVRAAPPSIRAAAVARVARNMVGGNADLLLAPEHAVATAPSAPAAPAAPAAPYHAALTRIGEADVDPARRIAALLTAAGLDDAMPSPPESFADALAEALTSPVAAAAGVAAAATVAGLIVAPAASSRTAAPAAALASAAVLVDRGLLGGPWVTTVRLDAPGRSAAVQLDRSGQWGPWVETFCRALAREADAVRSAATGVIAAFDGERRRVRGRRRVGATDEAVLAYLQGMPYLVIADASRALGLTTPTVGTSIARLESDGLAVEVTGRLRDRAWVAAGVHALAAGA